MSLSTSKRIFARIAGVLLLGIFLLLVIAWWRLPALLNFAAHEWLPTEGVEDVEFNVVRADHHRLVIEGMAAAGEGWQLRLRQIEARYTLPSLWRERRAGSIVLEGLEIAVDLERFDPSGFPVAERPASTEGIDLSWLAHLPAEQIVVEDGTVLFTTPIAAGGVGWQGKIVAHDGRSATVDVSLDAGNAEARVSGVLNAVEPSLLSMVATLPDAVALLERFAPDWRSVAGFPEDLSFALGESAVEAEVELGTDGSFEVTGALRAGDLDARVADGGNVAVQSVLLRAEGSAGSGIEGRLEAGIEEARWAGLHVPQQPVGMTFSSSDFRHWLVATTNPWQWNFEEASGALGISAQVDLATDGVTLDGSIHVVDATWRAIELSPFGVSFEGADQAISFDIREVAIREYPAFKVEGIRGEWSWDEGGEETEGAVRMSLSAGSAVPFLPELEMSPVEVEMKGRLAKEGISAEILVTSPDPASFRVRWAEEMMIAGGFDLRAELASRAGAESWSGAVDWATHGLQVRHHTLAGDEIRISGELDWTDLEMKALTAKSADLEDLAAQLARSITGRVDWQANRIAYGDYSLQWLSGGFELVPKDGGEAHGIDAQLATRIGSVSISGESLQQVDLAARAAGDVRDIAVDGEVRFLFDGSEGTVTFSHELKDVLRTPQLKGGFSLKPFAFEYSDLLSRQVPALVGLSFSGSLEGEGAYHLSGSRAEASMSVLFSDGSVDYPGSQINAEGLDIAGAITAVDDLTGLTGRSSITIDRIEAGDLEASDGRAVLDLLDAETVRIEEARLDLFGGRIALEPATAALSPLALNTAARFERISLRSIVSEIEVFDGTMEGVVSGHVPMTVTAGGIRLREGLLELPDGETAKLRYNASGMLTGGDSETANQSLSDRLLHFLGLKPEKVVEDALGDFTVTELRIDLFREDTPLTPVRIQLSGEARSGDILVPLHIDTNINGTLGELYNFIIRLNSLGSASF